MLFRIGDFMNKKKILKKKFRDNFANCFTSPISTLLEVRNECVSGKKGRGSWPSGGR